MKLLLLACILHAPLCAICLLPISHDGRVEVARTEVAIVHRAATEDAPGYQEMILRITPVFEGESPSRLAWIIPLPAEPLLVGIADAEAMYAGAEIHTRLFSLAREQWSRRTEYKWPEALSWMQRRSPPDADAKVKPLPTLELAGPLDATPLPDAAALRQWLRENGFDAPELAWFEENSFAFLAVLISPREGRLDLGRAAEIAPLQIALNTTDVFLPITAGPGQPEGALDIALVTDKPLEIWPYEFTREALRAKASGYVMLLNLWSIQPLPKALRDAMHGRAADTSERWYANRIESFGLPEAEGATRADFRVPPGGLQDELPGFWYYADQEISFVERFFREHLLAVTTTGFLLFVLLLVIKSAQQRRSQPRKREPTKETGV